MTDLGNTQLAGSAVALLLAPTQTVPAGHLVVVAVAGGTTAVTITDSQGNTYQAATLVKTTDTWTGMVAVEYSHLASTLWGGDSITATFSSSSSGGLNTIWGLDVGGVSDPDQQGATYQQNGTLTVSTGGAVTSTHELILGVSYTGHSTPDVFTLGAGYTLGPTWSQARSSGTMAYLASTAAAGVQTFAPVPNPTSLKYASAVVAFKAVTAAPPSALSLVHTPNNKTLTASWTGGAGMGGVGGCQLQFYNPQTLQWVSAGTVNCDVTAVNQSFTLSSNNWVAPWSAPVSVRLARPL